VTIFEVTEEADLQATLHRVFLAPHLQSVLTDGALSTSTPEVRDRVLAKAEELRLSLLGQVDSIPVADELNWILACAYMEYKAQWNQRQVRVCYEEMLTGSCDREVAAEASMISTILSLLEPLLDPSHLSNIERNWSGAAFSF